MKLRSLKFILPILLVLPNLVFADWIYQRTPEGTEITSPVSLYFEFDDWSSDVCGGYEICESEGVYWQFEVRAVIGQNEFGYCGEIRSKTTKRARESFDLPIGAKVDRTKINILDANLNIITEKVFEDSADYVFEIIGISPLRMIGNTQNWLFQNEILGYIGKLAEDIPNYIVLMIGLPIAFWFVEKIIAFVRGNFRSAEKIKEE
jgi:hypothetical protein